MAHGADINAQRSDGATALAAAVIKKPLAWCINKEMILFLKKHGAAVVPGTVDYPSIFEAVAADDTAAVAKWLDRGVPVDYMVKHYNTPVWAAVEYQSPHAFRLLLKRGADVGGKDKKGMTLLHIAADQPDPAFVPILVDLGIDVNVRGGNDGRTPLMLASEGGHLQVVAALLESGAKPGIEEGGLVKSHYTALVLAASRGHRRIFEVLAGDKKEIKKHGGLAVRSAAAGGHIDIVEFLLEKGADPNKSGKPSALEIATRKEYWEIVKLLNAYGAKK